MNLDLHQIRNEAMIAPMTFVFWCGKAPAITCLYASECPVRDSNRSLPTSGGLMADVPCLDRSLDGC